jgi:hypothetical protein
MPAKILGHREFGGFNLLELYQAGFATLLSQHLPLPAMGRGKHSFILQNGIIAYK